MIYLGADHGGFELKEKVKLWLSDWGEKYEDLGAKELDPDDDYPQYAFKVAEKVGIEDDMSLNWKQRAKGILLCRSAGGVVISANKLKEARAVGVYDEKMVKHAREHNDANIIAISGDWTKENEAKKLVKTFLDTEFSKEDRHKRRINQIREKEYQCGCC